MKGPPHGVGVGGGGGEDLGRWWGCDLVSAVYKVSYIHVYGIIVHIYVRGIPVFYS